MNETACCKLHNTIITAGYRQVVTMIFQEKA